MTPAKNSNGTVRKILIGAAVTVALAAGGFIFTTVLYGGQQEIKAKCDERADTNGQIHDSLGAHHAAQFNDLYWGQQEIIHKQNLSSEREHIMDSLRNKDMKQVLETVSDIKKTLEP